MESTSKNPDSTAKKKYLISKSIDGFFEDLYDLYIFIVRFFKEAFSAPIEWKEIVNQCYQIGYKTLLLVSVTGFITNLITLIYNFFPFNWSGECFFEKTNNKDV